MIGKLLNFVTFFSVFTATRQLQFAELKARHHLQELSNAQVTYLSGLGNATNLNEILDNVCIPRVVGTRGHSKVYDYIISALSSKGWDISIDRFADKTPTHGTLTFRNIIATLNPEAERFLVLSCHYDSKFFKEFDFFAATDSAVPCAMMLNLAHVMRRELMQSINQRDLSLKLIFFDGEEAFKSWTADDSIYGARHLARKYERAKVLTKSGFEVNELERMDVMVLLDLLGDKNPTFYSYFPETNSWYARLSAAEKKLGSLGLLKKYNNNGQRYFQDQNLQVDIQDDHIPFLIRGVPILHLIPLPFPKFWHKEADNRNAVDISTVENLNAILRVFVTEYLNLSLLDDDDDGMAQRTEL